MIHNVTTTTALCTPSIAARCTNCTASRVTWVQSSNSTTSCTASQYRLLQLLRLLGDLTRHLLKKLRTDRDQTEMQKSYYTPRRRCNCWRSASLAATSRVSVDRIWGGSGHFLGRLLVRIKELLPNGLHTGHIQQAIEIVSFFVSIEERAAA